MATYGEVREVRWLTPRLVRIDFGGPGLDDIELTGWVDQYINAQFIPDGAPYAVPFDIDEARQQAPEHRPRGRRYTIRSWDEATRTMTVDFVVHGDVGIAGRWATNAKRGDLLQFLGPSGSYSPDPEAHSHLLVGDESALPAIAAALEHMPPGRRVLAVVVVDDEQHHIELSSAADLEVTWVHRCDATDGDQLLRAVEALEIPTGHVQVFVHGEANEVRAVRRYVLGERGIPKEQTSISPYWRREFTDEQWRQVKADWTAATEKDLSTEP